MHWNIFASNEECYHLAQLNFPYFWEKKSNLLPWKTLDTTHSWKKADCHHVHMNFFARLVWGYLLVRYCGRKPNHSVALKFLVYKLVANINKIQHLQILFIHLFILYFFYIVFHQINLLVYLYPIKRAFSLLAGG